MSQNGFDKKTLFSFFYRNRVRVTRGSDTILNVSFLFMLISCISAPWLVIGGGIAALALGYRISIAKNAAGFGASFESVVKDAAENVKSTVESFTQESNAGNDPE